MASLVSSFEYDIFISYRRKDNKHDGWVTEFVRQLRGELESTFKEDISVYFDINPNDGLLETHDVEASLKDKLNCLVFIPVISRTYCDPGSYAWEHELKAFVELASKDRFGMKIKLEDGNVANRILPVRIHDLDIVDNKKLEAILGAPLRGIEFIYKEPGVNKPLGADDNEQKNLNCTKFKIQINKTANAIKEIITGMRSGSVESDTDQEEVMPSEVIPEKHEKSIAVLPFVNMSPEKDQDYFCDGITEEIINALAHIENLKVIARTSAFSFKNKQADIREIGHILNVETMLEGSIRKAGNKLRITAQLIRVLDGSHIWSERFDRDLKDIFAIQDEISQAIADTLKVKLFTEKKTASKLHKENLEAYNLYLKGTYYSKMLSSDGFIKASEFYEQALKIDPEYALVYVGLAEVTGFSTLWGNVSPDEGSLKGKEYVNKALKIDNNLAEAHAYLGTINAFFDWNWKEADNNFKKALEINKNSSIIHMDYAIFLSLSGRNNEALIEATQAKELDPLSWYINSRTGDVYYYACQYEKAIEEYRMSLTINPDYFLTHFQLGLSYAITGLVSESFAEFEKAADLSGGNPVVLSSLHVFYSRIGKTDQANKLYADLKKRYEKEYIPSTCFFLIHRSRGEEDLAIEWLRRACTEHDTLLPFVRMTLFTIPGGSKYISLIKEMGLG
jgi:adenylate cyclase